ncbi:MAG: sodium:solute symporter family protein [Woeseiaceae bacterium]
MSTETIILIGVSVYLLIMIAIGIVVSKRAASKDDFIVAGRKLPLWLCVPTIVATWFGAGTMLGAAGTGYEGGFLASIATPFGTSLTLVLVGFFFVRTLRRMKLLTVADFFENRFGHLSAMVAAVALVLAIIGWIGGLMVAFGYVFQTMTGVPMEIGILAGGVIVIAYTTIGGMWAVAVTDFVQVLIIAIGLVVLLVVVLVNVGGWGVIAPQLPEHTFRLVPLEYDAGIWLNYVRLWVIFGVADLASQSLMQRVFAADSDRTAQNAFYLAGAGHLFLGLIPVILGIIAIAIMPGLDDPQTIVPTMAIEYLHPVAIAIFVGAILAAIMSSADSALLAAASLIGINLAPAVKANISSDQKLKVTRIAIPVIGIIATYVALEVQLILDLMLDANSFLLAGVVGPYVAGVWWAKANRTGTLSAMAAGFSAWTLSEWIYPELAGDVVGFGVSLVTIVIVTLLTQKIDPPKALADENGVPINLKGRLGIG